MKTLLCLFCLALCLPSPGADLTLKNGQVLTDYNVLRKDVDGLHIAHKDSVSKVPPEQLTDELRAKYGWDAMKNLPRALFCALSPAPS